MKFKLTAILLIFSTLATSCSLCANPDNQQIDTPDTTETQVIIEGNSAMDQIIRNVDGEKITVPDFDGDFTSVLSDFSNKIYLGVSDSNDKKDNIIFSPLSVVYALALASNGAEGQTKEEFEYLFGGATVEEMNEYLLALTKELESSKDSKVVVGNSIWTNKNLFTLSREYLSLAERYYSAEARSVIFNDDAVREINNWVKEKTDGMIPKAIDGLSPDLATVLFNTVLFDGIWEKEYTENDVSDGKFFNFDGTMSDVEYLHSKENGTYFKVDGGVGFSKAYKDGYSFTAVLPNGDIDDFIKNLNINEILEESKKSNEDVIVFIPKFEYDYSTSLNKILQSMGLITAFTDDADFDKMAAGGNADIMISEVFQKAKIILNEHGTKAAAVTGIAYATCAAPIKEDKLIRLEKPFLYIIQDSEGNPLFIGTVYSLK